MRIILLITAAVSMTSSAFARNKTDANTRGMQSAVITESANKSKPLTTSWSQRILMAVWYISWEQETDWLNIP